MDAYEAFINGCKPSHLSAHIFTDRHERLLKLDYPKIQLFDDLSFFFASTHLKEAFVSQSQGLDFHSPEYKEVLGVALGYPPIAAKFFANTMRNPDLEGQGALYQYAGRYFGGHIYDKDRIAEWLWINVPLPPFEILMTYEEQEYLIQPSGELLSNS